MIIYGIRAQSPNYHSPLTLAVPVAPTAYKRPMDDCDVESEPGPLKQQPRLNQTDGTAGLYRVSPFTVSLFSGHALSVISFSSRSDREPS